MRDLKRWEGRITVTFGDGNDAVVELEHTKICYNSNSNTCQCDGEYLKLYIEDAVSLRYSEEADNAILQHRPLTKEEEKQVRQIMTTIKRVDKSSRKRYNEQDK